MEPIVITKSKSQERRGQLAAPSTLLVAKPKRGFSALSRILLCAFSVVLTLAFFFPLWNIRLGAPQYPDGLSLDIWYNRLAGNIGTINDLNHYIGMQAIHPESFPELGYMAYILGGFIALGIVTALANRKFLLAFLLLAFVAVGVAGCIDFYNWEFQYGHNLDPHAAIKIEGMSYQPPMLGYKQLLNFNVLAYPGIGGLAVIASGLAFGVLFVKEFFFKRVKS